jgi:hypothetical protein
MVDRRRADAVDEAAARFADTLAESYRIVYEHAAEAQERQARLARDFSERVLDHLKEQTESGRAASEQRADRRPREAAGGPGAGDSGERRPREAALPVGPRPHGSPAGPRAGFGPRGRGEPRPQGRGGRGAPARDGPPSPGGLRAEGAGRSRGRATGRRAGPGGRGRSVGGAKLEDEGEKEARVRRGPFREGPGLILRPGPSLTLIHKGRGRGAL